MKKIFIVVSLLFFSMQNVFAAFPEDFSDVVWTARDVNVSSWPETATLTVSVTAQHVILNSSKSNVWPAARNSILASNCCNANAWVFVKFGETWYASTWEWVRRGSGAKNRSALEGAHAGVPPFLSAGYRWTPQIGEIYGLMVSGFARGHATPVNIRERSNVSFYQWGVGPVDASVLIPSSATPPMSPVIDLLMEE